MNVPTSHAMSENVLTEIKASSLALLLTDLKNSDQLWELNPEETQAALTVYDEVLREKIKAYSGTIVKTPGNSFYAVFLNPLQALMAAYQSQIALNEFVIADRTISLKVSMALYYQETLEFNTGLSEEFFVLPENLLATAHGGQVLISDNFAAYLQNVGLPEGHNFSLAKLGKQLLKDLLPAQEVFQLAGESLPLDFPALKSLNNLPNNLPLQANSIVGRERDIETAVTLLRKKGIRLITFTGPGGTGKTRLSLQVAAEVCPFFQDGVFLVELANLTQTTQVALAITRVLDIPESSGRELIENLKQYLRERELLLVLDNFEQVMVATSLVSELLAVAPRLKILVSSRTILKIYGEQEFPVSTLALPDIQNLPVLSQLANYSAIRLFTERAKVANSSFRITESNAYVVAQICERLDGLPLAIELAAARMHMYQPESVLASLDHRLRLVMGGIESLPNRHQTLRAAIEWSYNLLEESEKILFARLGIFAGGCNSEVAEAICNADEDSDLDVLDGLTSLLDKSMLRLATINGENEPRFRMLETIREYALQKLEEKGELAQLQTQYANYFLALAREAEPKLTGPEQKEWFNRLEQEHSNYRAVIEWALKQPDEMSALPLEIGGSIWRFWMGRGYFCESLSWLERALLQTEGNLYQEHSSTVSPAVLARAYNAAGILTRETGDFERAKGFLELSLKLQRQLNDKTGLANALNSLGTVTSYLGDYDQARLYHEETLEIRRSLKDKRGIAISLCNLGTLAQVQAENAQARQFFEEALSLLRQQGDNHSIALLLHNLAQLYFNEGNLEKAGQLAEESLAFYSELGEKVGIALSLLKLADIAKANGELEQALKQYQKSLNLFKEVKGMADMPPCLEGLAGVLSRLGLQDSAIRLFGAAAAFRASTNAPIQPAELPRYEEELGSLKQQVTAEDFKTQYAIGEQLNLEQAIELALRISI
ncbi:MAG TPA: tetratricopeptide repeat protein [Chloroflexia bacterium]|nr:tetratricopeptide repeat protein [Chloroflexia bacterium]